MCCKSQLTNTINLIRWGENETGMMPASGLSGGSCLVCAAALYLGVWAVTQRAVLREAIKQNKHLQDMQVKHSKGAAEILEASSHSASSSAAPHRTQRPVSVWRSGPSHPQNGNHIHASRLSGCKIFHGNNTGSVYYKNCFPTVELPKL